jgi:hypothetical protein
MSIKDYFLKKYFKFNRLYFSPNKKHNLNVQSLLTVTSDIAKPPVFKASPP